jgi:hypothetical protein
VYETKNHLTGSSDSDHTPIAHQRLDQVLPLTPEPTSKRSDIKMTKCSVYEGKVQPFHPFLNEPVSLFCFSDIMQKGGDPMTHGFSSIDYLPEWQMLSESYSSQKQGK